MNTRTVDQYTTWTVLIMEAALVLPVMSLPTQGNRLPGVAGPLLLLTLLPAGCAAVYRVPPLRDPAWRLLTGISLALLTRAIVDSVPDAGLPGLLTWLARGVVPAAIGVGLWWRGGALAVAELTPADVRNEFSVVAVCLLMSLVFVRPFLLQDATLLGFAVALFALGGLLGAALSRQDAADVVARQGRTLAIGTSLLLPAITVFVVGSLRPQLLAAMWLLIAHAIELLLAPIGLLVAWLASLLPHGAPGPPPTPPPAPPPIRVDPALVADAQNRMAWLGTLIVVTLLVVGALALLLAARLLLSNFIRDPNSERTATARDDSEVEFVGTPGADAADLLGWLRRWLRKRISRRSAPTSAAPRTLDAADAWSAYARLLTWAETHGITRRPSETPGQLSQRLSERMPEVAPNVDVVTRAFEWERYGGVQPATESLRRIREALGRLQSQ